VFERTPLAPATLARVVVYYPSWVRASKGYAASSIPADRITHINYAFAVPNVHGACVMDNAHAAEENLAALQQLRQQNIHLRILLSVGGGGSLDVPFAKVVESPENMAAFSADCIDLLKKWDLDGLDLDWEFPKTEQKEQYTALLAELRRQLNEQARPYGPTYLLTVALPAGPWALARLEAQKIEPLLDWINLMTYDYYGSWSAISGHNAPLFSPPEDPQHLSITTTVQTYLAVGIPAAKLVVGVPFYGRGFQQNAGLFQSFTGVFGGGTYDYSVIQQKYLDSFERHWDEIAKVPWLYDPQQQVLISYEDPESLRYKSDYIRRNNLGGVMVWQIAGDDPQHSLLNALVGQ
jgi:chitinase